MQIKAAVAIIAISMVACGQPAKKSTGHAKECDESSLGATVCGTGCVVMVCRGGRFVVDEEATAKIRESEQKEDKRKSDLYWALRTRVLTDEEMSEVRQLGPGLLIKNWTPYRQEDIDREFNAALLQQFYIVIAARNAGKREK